MMRCCDTHPPLKLGKEKIYGGSCVSPVVTDASVYVGFDMGMPRTDRAYPWSGKHEFLYPIPDMGVPANLESFQHLLDYLHSMLLSGCKVHIGCIGGHGRTGLVLAALAAKHYQIEDAIQYVRHNYCLKAVETQKQVDFLVANFGVHPAPPSKVALRPVHHTHHPKDTAPIGPKLSLWATSVTNTKIVV